MRVWAVAMAFLTVFTFGGPEVMADDAEAIKAEEQRLQASSRGSTPFGFSSRSRARSRTVVRNEPGKKGLFQKLFGGKRDQPEERSSREEDSRSDAPVETLRPVSGERTVVAEIRRPEPKVSEPGMPRLKSLALQVLRRVGPVAVETSDEDVLEGKSETLRLLAHRNTAVQIPSAINEPLSLEERRNGGGNPLEMLQGPAPNSNWMVAVVEERLRSFSTGAKPEEERPRPGRRLNPEPPSRSGAMMLLADTAPASDALGKAEEGEVGRRGSDADSAGDEGEAESSVWSLLAEPPGELQPVKGLPELPLVNSSRPEDGRGLARSSRLRALDLLTEEP